MRGASFTLRITSQRSELFICDEIAKEDALPLTHSAALPHASYHGS